VRVRTVEFAGSLFDAGAPVPGDLPQVAFSGRSNVGKSSLINVLLKRTRKKLAHVSGTPGKTRSLNFYLVNDRFFLVDLPGFGFARVSSRVRRSWKALVENYLVGEPKLRGVVHLVDARHDPTIADLEMVEFLAEKGLPTLVVLTKMDKLKRMARERTVTVAVERLNIDEDQVLAFSSKTGEGREELLTALDQLIGVDENGPPEIGP
jgi:GTP-binding protein